MQIVGIEGQNPSGHYFTASKLLDTVPLTLTADVDLPPAKKQNLDQEVLTLAEESRETSEVSFVSMRLFEMIEMQNVDNFGNHGPVSVS